MMRIWNGLLGIVSAVLEDGVFLNPFDLTSRSPFLQRLKAQRYQTRGGTATTSRALVRSTLRMVPR